MLAVNAPTGGVHREESRLEGPSRDRDDAPKFGARSTQKEERCAGVPVARGLTADGSAVVPLLCPVTHRSLSDFPHTFDSPLAHGLLCGRLAILSLT